MASESGGMREIFLEYHVGTGHADITSAVSPVLARLA